MGNGPIGELMVAQIPRLRRYARSLIRGSEEADDLVQDCLERAWARINRWQPDTDLRAWMFTIMHNLYVNKVRRDHRRRDSESLEDHVDPDPRPAGHNGQMKLRDLELGLGQLPPDQREVLMLICVEELSYQQVSEVLGVPIGTVMSRLHRAREGLRRWMSGDRKPPLRRVK